MDILLEIAALLAALVLAALFVVLLFEPGLPYRVATPPSPVVACVKGEIVTGLQTSFAENWLEACVRVTLEAWRGERSERERMLASMARVLERQE